MEPPEVAPFANELRRAVLAHDVRRIVGLMEPKGLQCQAAPTAVSAVERELGTPGSFWHSFFFDSKTLYAKYSEAGEKRVALEEVFRSGTDIRVELQGSKLEFRSSNYDVYPKLYVKQVGSSWVISCDPRCDC